MSKRGTGRQQAFTPPTGPIPPGPSGTTDSNNNPLALGGNVDQHDNHDTVSDQAPTLLSSNQFVMAGNNDNASSSPSHQINAHADGAATSHNRLGIMYISVTLHKYE